MFISLSFSSHLHFLSYSWSFHSPGLQPRGSGACVWNIWRDVKLLLLLRFHYIFLYIFKNFLHFIYSFSSQAQISFSLGRLVRFRFFFSKQGVPGIIASLALTKTLALICDIRKGRLSDVPANLFLWWEEAQPKNLYVDFQTSFQTKPEFLPVRFSQSDSLPMSSRRNSCLSCIRT